MVSSANLEARHVAEMTGLLREHVARLRWTRGQVEAERQIRLRELIEAAVARSPWHARRLAHLDVARVTEADLATVPPMTKQDLMENWDAIVTDSRLSLDLVDDHLARNEAVAYLFDEFRVCASGGSSGRRGVFVYDWRGWMTAYLGYARHRVRYILRHPPPDDRPVRHVNIGAGHASHIGSIFRTFPFFPGESLYIGVDRPLAAIVSQLNEFQPTSILGYSSALALLAHEALRGTLHITPFAVAAGADPVLPEIRDLVQRAWGCRIINIWGTTECGFMAIGTEDDGSLLLNDDLVIVEPVDGQRQQVPPGTPSAGILLTNLFNHVLPLIRYEIEDEFTLLDEVDPNGSGHRQVSGILGRSDEIFRWSGNITAHPNVIRSPLSREHRVVEYQVLQTTRGVTIRLLATGHFNTNDLANAIRRGLERVGLDEAQVEIEFVKDLERTHVGKLRRFVPLA